MGLNYKDAGVDVEAGYKSVKLMGEHVKSTFRKEVLSDIGGFGGLFSLAQMKMEEPVLISGTDGVGTKLKLAFVQDKHNTVGIDCVAMCVNDIICNGAEPLFFLDYIACGKNTPEKIADIVSGVAEGCRQSGCALIGGETAEMPGFYPEDEYDMAGFAVGIVDKKNMITGENINEGDVIIGLPSSGIHSNGYSLVRKIFDISEESVKEYIDCLGETLGESLLRPTKIYVKEILNLIKNVEIKGISNITGGGFIENIPRCIPKNKNLCATIEEGTWPVLPIFELMQEKGQVERMSMYNTFNMGIGMVLVVAPENVDKVMEIVESMNEKAYVIGKITNSEKEVEICLK
ncbi:MAG: phosphoribosylformylglycinamidine cyclo-ligase [Tyzzerella sp.]|uniref:Phosphoribosylformylglycinamidine cyclo-ligase n=1 Tax=Candidatus Fimicola merdigallinarum TaxID=2840819 RepID=A0A9D9H2S6_9FIRM|nr:phosphoribosylformylglycinamidine cyclo-ligase [Candidatus Fimicola merdigallinarum]